MTPKEKFFEKVKEKWGNSIDCSKVVYEHSQKKVCLICHKKDKNGKEHGEYWQTPAECVRGKQCPKCANEKRGPKKEDRMTTQKFIIKAQEVHFHKYEYDNCEYVNVNTKVCIKCPIHGDFYQRPYAHLQGQGCPECSGRHKNFDDLVKKFNVIHQNKYTYIRQSIFGGHNKINIICPIHGKFEQSCDKHLQGQGCPKCGNISKNKDKTTTISQFIDKSRLIHGDLYDYNQITDLNNLHDKVDIICKKHGKFRQFAYDHLCGHGCPTCGYNISKAENEICDFLYSIGIKNIIKRNKNIIKPFEIDIFIPELNIGIEYNGLRWHSEQFKNDKNCHIKKLNICNEKNIKLIQIFEDEYLEHKDIVMSKIRHLLKNNIYKENIYARKCLIKEIDRDTSKEFLEKNHIQGFVQSTVYLGCYYNDMLIGIMSFKKENLRTNKWELNRFATDINKRCVGVGGKMFSYFINNYKPEEVKSFADCRWTLDKDDNLYVKLGFKLEKTLRPDYRYVVQNKRIHKFNFRKKIILKKYPNYGLTEDMTEHEMCLKLGFYRIWDCGLFKYVWKNNKEG